MRPATRLLASVRGEASAAGSTPRPAPAALPRPIRRPSARPGVGHLGNAVRDEIDGIDARDVLLLQQVDGLALLLAEERHQHVGAGDLVAARGLHVEDGALQHALEAECRLRLALVSPRGSRGRRLDELRELAAQLAHGRAHAGPGAPAGPPHCPAARAAGARNRHELVTPGPRPLKAVFRFSSRSLLNMVTPRYNSILRISIDQPAAARFRHHSSSSSAASISQSSGSGSPRETVHLPCLGLGDVARVHAQTAALGVHGQHDLRGLLAAHAEEHLKQPATIPAVIVRDQHERPVFAGASDFFGMGPQRRPRRSCWRAHPRAGGLRRVHARHRRDQAMQVNRFARENQHPLLCEIEAADDDEE